ncbi:MAG: glutathione S-transferase family protein [Planctomycetota bacterium]|nr:glutathione S-transferase family protein [Planctomycetota bacterium]MDG2143670.1 glutathione S-transferase family protein [Planctomycetota bacterium]
MSEVLLYQYSGPSRGTTVSAPCAKVHMALQFKGIDFGVFNCRSQGEVKKFNPRGRVPALKVDDELFVDSGDILTEIDRRWPDPPLLPQSAYDRARCRMIEDWASDVLYFQGAYIRWTTPEGFAGMYELFFSKLPFPLSKIVSVVAARKYRARLEGQGTGLKPLQVVMRDFASGMVMLNDLLEHSDFFCGDQITRADISVASMLDQFRSSVTPEKYVLDFTELPRLDAWLERLHKVTPSVAG